MNKIIYTIQSTTHALHSRLDSIRPAVVATLVSLVGFSGAHAAVIVDLPDLNLIPNTAGQSFELTVSNDGGGVDVTGIQLNLQVADGGAEAGGSTDGPSITAVDIFTGTIFENNNNGLTGGIAVPQIFAGGTLTSSGTVQIPNGSSTLASVTFDTTGFSSGIFTYTVENTLNGSMKYTTSGADLFPTFGSGSLTVSPVPEPSTVFGAIACLTFVGFRFRSHHCQQKGNRQKSS